MSGGLSDREERLAALIADVAARLRPACAHMSDAEFSAMVRDIALMKFRFAEIDGRPGSSVSLLDAFSPEPESRGTPPS